MLDKFREAAEDVLFPGLCVVAVLAAGVLGIGVALALAMAVANLLLPEAQVKSNGPVVNVIAQPPVTAEKSQ